MMKYAMKQGWKIMKLGEVCDIINGRNQKAVECADGQYPIYGSGGNVMGYASDYLCEAGTTIIGRKGSINNPIYIDTKFWNVDTAFGISSKPMMSSKFVYYFCKSFDFSKLNKGTTLPSLVKKDLLLIDIPAPSLSEQQRIVDLLDAEFANIDALKANAEKNLQNAKDLFQAALKKELEPKEGWEWSYLPSISENLDSKRIPITQKDRIAGVYPYYGASGIVDYVSEYLFDDDLLLISEDGANLLARSTPIAFSVSGKVWVNNHAHILKFKDMATQKIVEYYFASIFIDEYITGAAQPKLTQANMNKIAIPLPPTLTDQQSIVSRLDTLSEKCKALQANYEKTLTLCDDLKQALLRKAFNGEI